MKTKSLLTLVFSVLVFATVFANSDAEKTACDLLNASGAGNMTKQMVQQMLNMQKQTKPDVPGEVWEEIMGEVDTEELMILIAPVYAQHFTVEEMKEIIAFYKTPAGKKMVEKQPAMMQQTMMLGQKWGMELEQKITTILKEKGHGGENANLKVDSKEFKVKSEKE
jgi:uncharacterized protein